MRIAKLLEANGLGAAGLAMVAGGVGWYAMLMRPILAASAYGPICGHALLGPHCAACYAALGMAGVGLGLVAAGEAGRPVVAPVRIGARARRRG